MATATMPGAQAGKGSSPAVRALVVRRTARKDGTAAVTEVTATAEGVTSAGGIGGMNGGPPGATGR